MATSLLGSLSRPPQGVSVDLSTHHHQLHRHTIHHQLHQDKDHGLHQLHQDDENVVDPVEPQEEQSPEDAAQRLHHQQERGDSRENHGKQEHQEMSRRKQRNPKSLPHSEDSADTEEDDHHRKRSVESGLKTKAGAGHDDGHPDLRRSRSGSPDCGNEGDHSNEGRERGGGGESEGSNNSLLMIRDASSLVKVELHNNSDDENDSLTDREEEHGAAGGSGGSQLEGGSLLNHHSHANNNGSGIERLTGSISPGRMGHPGAASGLHFPTVEDVMRKWNMFQLGEVRVAHHPPGLPLVPMALQMVYLFPMAAAEDGSSDEVKYRLLVPIHQNGSPPPPVLPGGGSSGLPPVLPLSPPVYHHHPQHQVSASSPSPPTLHHPAFSPGAGLAKPPKQPPALHAARKKTTEETTREEISAASTRRAVASASPDPIDLTHKPSPSSSDTQQAASLLLLQQAAAAGIKSEPDEAGGDLSASKQRKLAASTSPNSLLESQINLMKIRELELMKNSVTSGNRCNDCNITFSKHQNYLAHKKYYCSGSKQQQTSKSGNDSEEESSGSRSGKLSASGSSPSGQVAKCKSPRNTSSASPSAELAASQERMTRELILKQQEAIHSSLLSGMKNNPALPLLMPNPRLGLQAPSHFVCEGCGIRFKSISNLQAHQTRYCSGIKKSEELRFFEALMKAGAAASSATGSSGLLSPSDMVALLAAKQVAEAATAAGQDASQARDEPKQAPKSSPTRTPSGASGGASSGASAGTSQSASEDFCCILCGLKESSVDKLKDHINMHFIGQVKKRKNDEVGNHPADPSPDESSPPALIKRIKKEDDLPRRNGSPSDQPAAAHKTAESSASSTSASAGDKPEPVGGRPEELRCDNCNIVFTKPTTFAAHKQYYCQTPVKKE